MPANEARETAKTLKLAALDFALAPILVIRQELKLSQRAINNHRATDLYKETVQELKESFREKMLAAPGTNELRKKINYGVGIGVDKIVHILSSPRTANRDIVAATRLIAMMDGRFIGSESEDGHVTPADEDLRQELVTAVKRHRETLQ